MPRHYAFLRAINVGGHTVTMAKLCELFEGLGFTDVTTFIASGNVIFTSPVKNTAALEKKIEAHLEKALGYEVKTFVRTGPELAALAAHKAFPAGRVAGAGAFCIGFLSEPLSPAARKALDGLANDNDAFHLNGREIYWLCKTGQADSEFSNNVFEKATKARVTFRGAKTVTKLLAKWPL